MTHDFDRVVPRRGSDSNKWHRFGPDVLPLWVADMDFPSPEPVIRALRERVEHGIFGYGYELPALHEVLVDRLVKRHGWRVAPEAIVPLPGVIPGLNLAARALAGPGEGLLMLTPVYPPILRCPTNLPHLRQTAPLARRPDGRYEVDPEALEAAITPATRALILCNPHNPVGRTLTREELAAVAAVCLRRGLAIIADEIHGDLVLAGHRHVPIASLDREIEARTITLMAPSKTYNLAGLKASVAVIPDAGLRERFVAERRDLVQTVNVLGYLAMLVAYRDGQDWLDDLLAYLEGNRDLVTAFVRERLPGVAMTPPEATYLAWLDCRAAGLAPDPFTFFLEQARVALNDGVTFGPGGEGFVRLNFGCPRATLLDGLERMRAALARADAA